MKPAIITHRGLEPSKANFFPESSVEAFSDQLERGFGLEFDLNFTRDGIVINHDSTLERITDGHDIRSFSQITVKEATSITYGTSTKGSMPAFDDLMRLIDKSSACIHAMHLKGEFQTDTYLKKFIEACSRYSGLFSKMFVFDLKIEVAKYIKDKLPDMLLTLSVAHPYDVRRYNDAVKGTLYSIEEAISNKDLYDWVLLDEWDLSDKKKDIKKLHTGENYDVLRDSGLKIAIVTPELHGSSPGLLGGEAHPDAKPQERLFARITEIIKLHPDAIITDYPEEVRKLV